MKTRLIFVCLTLAATIAAAQEMPKPSPKLKELNYFAGTWSCKGEFLGGPNMPPAHPTTSTVKAMWVLGGYWLEINYVEDKTAKNPMPFDGRIFWGWDEGSKKFAAGNIDNTGGYGTETSDGWNGTTLTLEGPSHMGPMTARARDVFTKKSDKELMHSGEIEDNGKWKKMDEETCTRK